MPQPKTRKQRTKPAGVPPSGKPEGIPGNRRVVIEKVSPEVDSGAFPIKRVAGEEVVVQADVFAEGHDEVNARLLYRIKGEKGWTKVSMRHLGNDRWEGRFMVKKEEFYEYTVEGWVNAFQTWQHDFRKKYDAGQDIRVDLEIGLDHIARVTKQFTGTEIEQIKRAARRIQDAADFKESIETALSADLNEKLAKYPDPETIYTYPQVLSVRVERPRALFSSWYEFFPRSFGPGLKHGTFKDCEKFLPEIRRMGFDVVYLPPVHPIGRSNRKGRNNNTVAGKNAPGCPWAIGAKEGGHKAVHPELGTMKDFTAFVQKAEELGMEVALDLAYQCSPDHPYVKEHPQWFKWRPDGTVQHAENPPKKYEDVLPINFETEDWQNLWLELKSIVTFWMDKGVRIFRVDNPHTKPFIFWKWLIAEIHKEDPGVIFLAEAFTRPKVMQQLAKLGFTQSYTYFTWRTSQWDFIEYLTELTQTEMREYFRPNFWPNTPDILPYHLQHGGRPAFIARLIMAATLSSNYGMYGPAYEVCEHEAVAEEKEEYLHSEKYEIKEWDRTRQGNIVDIVTTVNRIRRENPALQTTWNLKFCQTDNSSLLCYTKVSGDNRLLIVVNLDFYNPQSGWIKLPFEELGLSGPPLKVTDLITDDKYYWNQDWNYVALNPYVFPAHIFKVEAV